jgi:hypothetical protein
MEVLATSRPRPAGAPAFGGLAAAAAEVVAGPDTPDASTLSSAALYGECSAPASDSDGEDGLSEGCSLASEDDDDPFFDEALFEDAASLDGSSSFSDESPADSQITGTPEPKGAGGPGEDWIEFRLPSCPLGLVEVEVASGAFLSAPAPLLVLPCDHAAAELQELQSNPTGAHSLTVSAHHIIPLIILILLRRISWHEKIALWDCGRGPAAGLAQTASHSSVWGCLLGPSWLVLHVALLCVCIGQSDPSQPVALC